jgi:hypothetical protein
MMNWKGCGRRWHPSSNIQAFTSKGRDTIFLGNISLPSSGAKTAAKFLDLVCFLASLAYVAF